MTVRSRNGWLHYRFKLDGREYSVSTGLEDTRQNRIKAQDQEAEHRKALREGRKPEHRITVREFTDAAADFLTWAAVEYTRKNSSRRISMSLTSARVFFGSLAVSMIDPAHIERYKVFRLVTHKVRDITLRHDLHALSKFFRYAIQQHWTNRNPISEIKIPSDKDAQRIHVLTPKEEQQYFARAAKRPDLFDAGRLMLN